MLVTQNHSTQCGCSRWVHSSYSHGLIDPFIVQGGLCSSPDLNELDKEGECHGGETATTLTTPCIHTKGLLDMRTFTDNSMTLQLSLSESACRPNPSFGFVVTEKQDNNQNLSCTFQAISCTENLTCVTCT